MEGGGVVCFKEYRVLGLMGNYLKYLGNWCFKKILHFYLFLFLFRAGRIVMSTAQQWMFEHQRVGGFGAVFFRGSYA